MDEATRVEIERLRDENTRQNHRIEALEQNAEGAVAKVDK